MLKGKQDRDSNFQATSIWNGEDPHVLFILGVYRAFPPVV